jgi:hypothetical protein
MPKKESMTIPTPVASMEMTPSIESTPALELSSPPVTLVESEQQIASVPSSTSMVVVPAEEKMIDPVVEIPRVVTKPSV